eukprot:Gregarina_sp_Pseudo_9__3954@NODE_40_length_5278_cov_10_517465_g37_i0_p2_GENE_NODE_40_length_5278_cov_10_517465_g37_i0NODE_40_length_5278_cov_10_517465_g37_i0_p2_ORF_typecomplete_len511_score74_75CarSlike/PF01864_17/2_9e03CarSlike/PF01864_17/0_0035CarSlike/PF01864_17/3e03DUF373/PF04123_13/0_34Consortin_C/PF15281_6/0_2Consortin_C/PF15281_6/5_2e03Consortin_C/PF15281_6/4_4e02CRTlike/PF08627_10/18CRTlike/PF08627_10/10CRTlike/PF08627_10/2e02_NODE_40_length_5278_cov_10_517465_g37_i021523684
MSARTAHLQPARLPPARPRRRSVPRRHTPSRRRAPSTAAANKHARSRFAQISVWSTKRRAALARRFSVGRSIARSSCLLLACLLFACGKEVLCFVVYSVLLGTGSSGKNLRAGCLLVRSRPMQQAALIEQQSFDFGAAEDDDDSTDLWVCLPRRALGAAVGVLCGGAFVWFHEGVSRDLAVSWKGAASPVLLGVYAACCFATTVICLVRPGPSLWPLLRNFRIKSYGQWTFILLGPLLLLSNLLFIYSVQLIGLQLTLMVLGICLPLLNLVFDLVNSFHFRTMRCRTKSGRPKHLSVPDKFETVQSLIGCLIAAAASAVFFYPDDAARQSSMHSCWMAVFACLACAFLYYSTTHVYFKFQRASRVACTSYWTIVVFYGLYCVIVWSSLDDAAAPSLDIQDLPVEAGTVTLVAIWNLVLVMGGVFSAVRVGLAPSAVCWLLGAAIVDWTCSSFAQGSALPRFAPNWSPAQTAAGACCLAALVLFVATLTFNLKTLVAAFAERPLAASFATH